MSNDGYKPPVKELSEFKKAYDATKIVKWTGFSPLKGASWTRTILFQYHGNLQLLANVPFTYMKTPLFVIGSLFVSSSYAYYKYTQSKLEDKKIKQEHEILIKEVVTLRKNLQEQTVRIESLTKEIEKGSSFWGTIKGWFK